MLLVRSVLWLFIEEICQGFLSGIISLWLNTETDEGIRKLYLLLKLLCMPGPSAGVIVLGL